MRASREAIMSTSTLLSAAAHPLLSSLLSPEWDGEKIGKIRDAAVDVRSAVLTRYERG